MGADNSNVQLSSRPVCLANQHLFFPAEEKKNLKMGLPVLLDLQILFFLSPPPNSPPSICAQCGGCDGRSLLYSACAGAALRLSLAAAAFSGRRAVHTLENDKK